MICPPVEALAARVSTNGSSPLLIHYDLAANTRVELSAVTFANWVDKTVNLMDDLGINSGDLVSVPLLNDRPDHWASMIWAFACWQFGSPVLLNSLDASLVVCGPNAAPISGKQVVSCSLHPFGLANTSLDAEVIDYAEVLAQPDNHWCAEPNEIAVSTLLKVRFIDLPSSDTSPGRILIADPEDPVLSLGSLCSVLRKGSLVVTLGGNISDLERIMNQELVSSGDESKSSSEKT